MHYRHAFHAGNFADLWKHVILLASLDALSRKPAPWAYLDTHAGAGLYRLGGEAATRTGEWREGIGRLRARADAPQSVARYLQAVAAAGEGHYPGSPWLAMHAARDGDRLMFCEQQAEVCAALRELAGARAAVHARDGYGADALLPPAEKRGLVLIDPPFERRDEFAAVADFIARGRRRFAHGVYLAWYPLKHRYEAERMVRRVARDAGKPVLNAMLRVGRPAEGRMRGCGMLLVNPPYGLDETLAAPLQWLATQLAQDAGAGCSLEWVAPA